MLLPFQPSSAADQSPLVGDQIPNPISIGGWRVYWNMTYDNALGLYNVSYRGNLILNEVLMTGITVTYLQHTCFFYDEIGSRPPDPADLSRYENATLEMEDIVLYQPQQGGFNITEAADVPGYTYGQQFVFYPDGRFLILMRISGGGCFDIHTYRANWKLDFNLGGNSQNTVSTYTKGAWLPIRTEADTIDTRSRDPAKNFTNWQITNGSISYFFTPYDSPQPLTDPPHLLVEVSHPGETENSHAPAVFDPGRNLNGERVYRSHVAVWYMPEHTQDVYRELYFKVPLLSGLMFYPTNG